MVFIIFFIFGMLWVLFFLCYFEGVIFCNFISEVCIMIIFFNINFRFVFFCIRLIKMMILIMIFVIVNFNILLVIFRYMVNNYNVKY